MESIHTFYRRRTIALLVSIWVGIAITPAWAQENAPVGNPEDGRTLIAPPTRKAPLPPPASIERMIATVPAIGLTSNGVALLPIVIAGKASPATKAAAAELASYLQRISGAPFVVQNPEGQPIDVSPVVSKTKPAIEQARSAEVSRVSAPAESLPAQGIILGTREEWQIPELAEPLAIHGLFDGRESFAIRTQTNRLLLVAATDRSVSHVVCRFLESLGCRWYFPNSRWEIIPTQPQLAYGLDITDRPTIAARSIFFSDGGFSDEGVSRGQSREPRDLKNWQRHNLLGGSLDVNAGHMGQNVVKDNLAVLRDHPEYFAEVGGKRTGLVTDAEGKPVLDAEGHPTINLFAKLELADPAVRQMFMDYARKRFREHPETDMISLDPSDGGGHSDSEAARKLGSVSDSVFGLANEVARMAQREFPGKMVGLLAYNFHIAPPSFPLEPNIYIELTAGFNMSKLSYDELFDQWPRKATHLGFYEYFSVYDWDQDKLPGGRIASLAWLKDRMRVYAGMKAVGISAQSGNSWGPHGRGYYLASKLMWNPDADADAILTDFYEKAYGPAAPIMKRYHERISPDSSNLVSTVLLGQAFRDVDEATKVSADRTDVLARLGDIKQYLRYLHLRWVLDEETDKVKKKEAFITLMRQLYASRYTYMTHWAAAAYRLGKIYGVALNDIELVPSGGRGHSKFSKLQGDITVPDVWIGTPELTLDQIEADFQEGLRYFAVSDLSEQPFDLDDLVPVQFPPYPGLSRKTPLPGVPDGMRMDYYQGGPRYAFHSSTGEAIKLDISTGRLAQYRGRGDATWWLRGPGGATCTNLVATGRMPLDNQPHSLSIPVPTNGTYILEFKSNGSGWTVTYPTNRPASVLWPRGTVLGFGSPVFYVPKGTRALHYFWNGGKHDLYGPDGKVVGHSSGGMGTIVTIPVPAGMDGGIWSLRTTPREIWFFNIPNSVAATPDALMIPRDLAEKDGLLVRHPSETAINTK
jgi:hypothetical protein